MIFIRHPFNSSIKVLDFGDCTIGADVVRNSIGKHFGYKEFTLLYNGKKLYNAEVIPNNSTVHVVLSLPGGKGGFGSMLRAIGAQIEKTTNREACRDLSGRRLRDINEEQRLKKWIAKKAEREAEKIRRRKERLERLKQKPAHKFFDYEYEREISQLPERINDALNEGLQKAKQTVKRPLEDAGPSKPKKTWLGEEFPSSSSDSDSDEMISSDNSNSAKKFKTESTESSGCCSDVSEASQSRPSSSKMGLNFDSEESLANKSDCESARVKALDEQKKENSNDSEKMDIDVLKDEDKFSNNQDVSDVPQPQPNSSKTDLNFDSEESLASKSDCKSAKVEEHNDQKKERRNDSVKTDLGLCEDENKSCNNQTEIVKEGNLKGSNQKQTDKKVTELNMDKQERNQSASPVNAALGAENPGEQPPINLLDFQAISDIEALGLDRLKTELMSRGLKCGGSLSDRAQRLWKIRGLQPNQYPSNLLAKNKK